MRPDGAKPRQGWPPVAALCRWRAVASLTSAGSAAVHASARCPLWAPGNLRLRRVTDERFSLTVAAAGLPRRCAHLRFSPRSYRSARS